MKNFNITLDWESPTFGKYRRIAAIFTLFALFFTGNVSAQGGCSGLTPSFINYEPCKYRVQIVNTSDCFTPTITVLIDANAFETWSANTAGGWTGQELAPNVVQLTHSNPFMPLGTSFPMIFTLPTGITTLGNFNWEYTCFPGESCTIFPGIELISCPDPMDASIIGVKYRECGSLPYSNQTTISDWTIQLLNVDGNVLGEQVTDAGGNYSFYDLPVGNYIVKETQQPGWTSSVPATGQYTVDLAPSQQTVRNFGNCPSCSCDNIYMDVVQLPISSDTCSYILNVSNNDDYCFNEIDLKVAVGSFASVIPAAGWTATMVTAKHYKLTYPPNYIPAQSFQSTFFKVTGAVQHDITVSTSWNNNGVLVTCSRPFSYQCPPQMSPPPCCPAGNTFGPELVCNSDFSLGNQCFTNNYNYFNPGGPTSIGAYSVLDYGQVYTANNQWACIDHTTYTTTGLMLVVDGYNGPNAWQQQVNVTAGTTYSFSAWVNNLVKPSKDYADPQMALFVDNNQIAGPLNLTENPDKWMRLCDTFTAQQTGLVTLYIRMLATTSIGNDVAIDDVSLRACSKNPCIEDFETGGTAQWATTNGTISVITDPFTGSMVLKGSDNQGASWMYNNSSDYNGDWTQKFNNCLCFDIRYDNGAPANPATGTSALVIYQGSGPLNFTKRATFVVNPAIGNTWTRVCVPVGLSNGTTYPSNQYGQWTSTSLADFDMVMQGVSGIGIPLDFGTGGGPSPSEMVFVDNFCVEQCVDTCFCGAWTDINYRPYQGAPNQSAECGDTLVAQCKGLIPWTMSGNFTCQGNACPPTIPMSWMLTKPNGGMVSGPMSGPNFNLSIPASDLDAAGLYHLVLKAICGMDTCYCEFEIKVDNCPCIEDFETGGTGQWATVSGSVSVITDPFTGSMVLKGSDGQGASWMYNNSSAYNGDWTQKFNNCLCFDIRYDNGDPANPATGTSALVIYQGSGPLNFTKRATFVVNPAIGNTWTRVCVPVGLSNGTTYPSNQYGQWTSTSLADFDMVMQGVSGIGIPLDFAGGNNPSEMVFVDNFCVEQCAGTACECKKGDLTYSSAGVNHTIPCQAGPSFPVFFCPTGPVTISGNFGCVDPNGNPCPVPPAPINWTLYHNGIIQQGAITTGSPWSLPFTAADLHGSGFFTLYMTTLCPGQMDSCKCVATWFQECSMDTCECGPNPWDLEFRYGGAQNIPVQCGQTLNVTTGSAFYPKFNCQGPANCGRVDWFLTGPDGYLQFGIGVVPGPGGAFVIPDLQPTNLIDPGTYTLQMIGICGQDTCPCTVYFCLPPPPPNVNDASICRTLQSVYIPLQGCPTSCDIAEVQWFIKPCSASNWPTTPYQVSSAGNPQDCDDLLFLPYQYPNETCVQVYAVIKLDPGCCVPELTSNIATITLCNPISCSISNPNTVGFCQFGQPLPLTGMLSGANCNYTVEWYNDAGQLVSNSLTYTPPVLNFPSGSTACYKDFTFTMKVIGICGASTCSTTIRVFNGNSDNGDLVMDPLEPQPFCPGEDARLTYLDKCSGPPPKWLWYSSTVSGSSGFTPLLGTGMMNPTYYTNQLYQTTWYMVESRNGVCPIQQDKLKIEVKAAISITNFTAVPDPCVDNYVVLNVGFTPTPITGAGCQYIIDWYYNGNLIHTSTSLTSTVTYTYLSPTPGMGSMAGVYYAVVRDNCCPGAATSLPVVLNPTCVPGIDGPCYVCDKTTQYTLTGGMVLPPQDPCPPGATCTYQWYRLDITTGLWVPVGTPNSLTFTTMCGGHFRFESVCDYGYGPCIRSAYHDVAQCISTGTGCMYVDAPDVILPIGMQVEIHPNPTTGSMTVQINPTPLRKGRIEVVDVNGKVLISDNILENQASHTMSLGHLPNGIYFVRVFESDMLLWVGKIVRSE